MKELKLKRNTVFKGRPGPLVVVIMDGIGWSESAEGNAVKQALTPVLDELLEKHPHLLLQAHGTAVGLPTDKDMGNSEVGHNAIGAGRVFAQGARRVNKAIEEGDMWEGETWKKLINNCKKHKGILHFIGLFSDGNVHSHIKHLKAMLRRAKKEGIDRARIHILLDGRDVPEKSALKYVVPFESFLDELNDANTDFAIASGGGRMLVTMDRYESDWAIVKRGWQAHVLGKADTFDSAEKAIKTLREKDPDVTDQFLPPFVIERDGKPVGPVQDGDSVIFFNFRGDRAIEISRAFEEENFDEFQRERVPEVEYAGIMEYDGDLHIPKQYLVSPPSISHTMGEVLARNGISQLACSETQKYGHVTYFWNGNRSGKFDDKNETYIQIDSDLVPFEQRPWMKSAEITDRVIKEMETGKYCLIRINYPNGDMVGHTGKFHSAVIGVESVDLGLGRLLKTIKKMDGLALITADHGNSEEMFQLDKNGHIKMDKEGKPNNKTSHTLNPVPFIIYDPSFNNEYKLAEIDKPGLSNVAATCIDLLGYVPPTGYDRSLIEFN
ncbi:MAG: 2,3-bisphosphoglycerate-independent phosphoglycerate mutase [bacterium]